MSVSEGGIGRGRSADTMAAMKKAPIIGITLNRRPDSEGAVRYDCGLAYDQCVKQAGGVPIFLTTHPELIDDYLRLCDGFLFIGGADLRMESFGQTTHPKAQLVDSQRQLFETALLRALNGYPEIPVLGVCLGMQLITMVHGGVLHQHLPEFLGEDAAARHNNNSRHTVKILEDSALGRVRELRQTVDTPVVSWHHQAVRDPGKLRIVARSDDQVIEAVDDPRRRFYLGVQWHPERGGEEALNLGVFARLVEASASSCARSRG